MWIGRKKSLMRVYLVNMTLHPQMMVMKYHITNMSLLGKESKERLKSGFLQVEQLLDKVLLNLHVIFVKTRCKLPNYIPRICTLVEASTCFSEFKLVEIFKCIGDSVLLGLPFLIEVFVLVF